MARTQTQLSSGWEWKLASSNGRAAAESNKSLQSWQPASQFPSVIQLELLHLKAIPDPNLGENERLIQWVGESDWEYRTKFSSPSDASSAKNVDLVFEGLDTFATVKLNGKVILESDNMFLPQRVDVKALLKKAGEENELSIVFESAVKKGEELEKKFGERTSMMRDKKRMHLRKAQYHWGWDWGPIIVTSGPWLPIYLDVYEQRIDNAHLVTSLAEDHSQAEVAVTVNLAVAPSDATDIKVQINDPSGKSVQETSLQIKGSTTGTAKVTIQKPQLWWPNGQGSQPLYTATVTLSDSKSQKLDSWTSRFGIRKITLIQRPLKSAPGTTFLFNVNGRDIFIQGGDWIPADNLLPRLTKEKYRGWVELAKRAHMNMIRVWGGGIYESEDFFDACDELGILVWHDYAFACGDFPVHKEFLENVEKEVAAQTIRLRNRTSLALLCGGNEDFMLADFPDGEALPGIFLKQKHYDHTDTKGPFEDTEFPQRKIYLDIIPKAIKELAPEVQYWASSPWGGKDEANDRTVGDIHQWDVWHGKSRSYQDYKTLSGRFVSEFGMHGYPDMRTVNEFAPRPEDRHPQSRAIDCHNKGHGAETRIARYLAENFRYTSDLEEFAYTSQLMQSEAYGYALRDWKRLFNGKGNEECAGLIIWQFNDVYPCTSWAYVDFHLRPKPAYYNIKRSFAPISVGIDREPRSRWIDDDKPRDSEIPTFSVWAHNTTPIERKLTLRLKAYDLHTRKAVPYPNEKQTVTLKPGQNTELGRVQNPDSLTEESLIILAASLIDPTTGAVEARLVNWPEPFRYLQWHPDTAVQTSITKISGDGEWEDEVTVSANYPVKGAVLHVGYEDGEEAVWEDNVVDLLPGEEIKIRSRGLEGRKVEVRFLNDWELKGKE